MKNKLLAVFIAMAMLFTQLSIISVSADDDTTHDWLHSVTLRPIDATYTSQHGEDANINFYDSPNMMVNYTNRVGGTDAWGQYGYMKFDIGNINRESVTSAKLRLYVENAGDKTSSTRTVGIFETWESDWDGSSMTWATGRSEAREQLDSFTVTASGGRIIDAGWRELDVTDCVRNGIDPYLSLIVKMTSEVGYRVAITSGTYNGLPEDFDENIHGKNMPQLVIESCNYNVAPTQRIHIVASQDTYVEQNGTSYTTNFSDNEYLKVNYTDNEGRTDYYGSYSYLDFDVNDVNRENISSAKLWVYIDKESDKRKSTRTIGVFKPSSEWDSSMTWSSGRVASDGDAIASFTVNGNGYYVVDPGWRCIDVTEYVKNLDSNNVSFMMKATEGSAHPVLLRSNEYNDEETRPRLIVAQQNSSILNANYNGNLVSITGDEDNGGKQVLIRIFNPDNSLAVIDQITSDGTGHFEFNYNLKEAQAGTYQVFASIEDNEHIQRTTFDVETATEINVINTEPVSSILKPNVKILLNRLYLKHDDILTVNSTMKQNIENDHIQNISTIIVLYNSDGTMKSYSASSIDSQPNSSEKLNSDVLLPSDVTGMTLKVFTLEGKNTYSGSMIPLSNPYIMNRTQAPANGGAPIEFDKGEPLFINDVVFPEYAEKYSVYDISYYYGQESAYHEKVILPGQILTISGKIKNKKSTDANIGEAFYTQKDGKAQFVQLSTHYTIKPGETRTVSWEVPSEYTAYPPNSDPVYPSNWISDEGGLTTEHKDYFGDNIKESVLVEKDRFIKGKIDTIGDIDCVKFVAPTTGYYEVAQVDGIEMKGQLFAENLINIDDPLNGFEEIKSSVDTTNNVKWGGELKAGKTYAIRLSSANVNLTGDYVCSISLDTDGDGLVDVWEISGDINGDGIIDILGADPYKTDIYVEINWMKGFKPSPEALRIVKKSFEDSKAGYQGKGINLHNEEGKEYPHIEIVEFAEDYDNNIETVLEPYFTDPIRKYAYHCALFGDKYCMADDPDYTLSSGFSSFDWSQVLFIAMGCKGEDILTPAETAGTYMHELGHNFNLNHGGQDECNYKPNYLSIMNYAFQFDGLYGTGKYDYSHYTLPSLDEKNLIESNGFDKKGLTKGTGLGTILMSTGKCFESIAEKSCDFNGNGKIDTSPIAFDLNDDNELSVLNSFSDWDKLNFSCGKIGKRINSNSASGLTLLSVDSHKVSKEMGYDEYRNNIKLLNNN